MVGRRADRMRTSQSSSLLPSLSSVIYSTFCAVGYFFCILLFADGYDYGDVGAGGSDSLGLNIRSDEEFMYLFIVLYTARCECMNMEACIPVMLGLTDSV
jgi:hypothetical protein